MSKASKARGRRNQARRVEVVNAHRERTKRQENVRQAKINRRKEQRAEPSQSGGGGVD